MFIKNKIRKDIFITGKKELKFLKFLFPGISYIFVDRKNNAIPALKAGADILRQGKSLIIFPEGTRSSNGVLKEFKTGAAFLAKELKKTIIPMTINGAFKIFPKNRLFPRFITKEKITLTIGKKINPVNYKSIDRLNSVLFNTIKGELILRN
ncbi:MAG: hypothetical protein B6229_10465 [Spirochaetaceae bacterium 4572_7]|nr:MAG: hypothetical protein B6229_10465 [Spirochaetaceae bacterium 4572_7]